jgi:hypothetical protein
VTESSGFGDDEDGGGGKEGQDGEEHREKSGISGCSRGY